METAATSLADETDSLATSTYVISPVAAKILCFETWRLSVSIVAKRLAGSTSQQGRNQKLGLGGQFQCLFLGAEGTERARCRRR